jgi:hypothetical protein
MKKLIYLFAVLSLIAISCEEAGNHTSEFSTYDSVKYASDVEAIKIGMSFDDFIYVMPDYLEEIRMEIGKKYTYVDGFVLIDHYEVVEINIYPEQE